MGPATLAQVLRQLPLTRSEHLLVGPETADDAAVYRLNEKQALIFTVDFFPPVVDDPYLFGRIAAVNSLNDVYAMGGTPILALNLVCFPQCLDTDVLVKILKGGAEAAREAGAILAGGHTIDDSEPKYGLAVVGLVHPQRVITNAGARPGDILYLTKPLGTGIIVTAARAELIAARDMQRALAAMAALNKDAAAAMNEVGVSACTDITGFGLLGHAYEMAAASNVTIEIKASTVPLLPGALEAAGMGLIPAGAYRNRDYFAPSIRVTSEVNDTFLLTLYDPQTAGGLLMAVPPEKETAFVTACRQRNVNAVCIGRVLPRVEEWTIIIT